MHPLQIAAVPAALAVVIALAAVALPARYTVERSITIHADKAAIADAVGDLSRRTAFVAWVEKDPGARYDHVGAPGQPGSALRFVGDTVGAATISLVSRTADEIDTRIDFEQPMKMTARDRFVLENVDGGVRVRWVNSADVSGACKVFALVADRVLGPDYEAGLRKLKASLEAPTQHT